MTDAPLPLVDADEAEAMLAERDVAIDAVLARWERTGRADAPPASSSRPEPSPRASPSPRAEPTSIRERAPSGG